MLRTKRFAAVIAAMARTTGLFERAPSRFDPTAMRRAVRERRKVAITYAKAQSRAVDRVVRPVALIHATRHGSATTWKLVCRLDSNK